MIACYCRVSTREQAVNGYSIDEQSERLKAFCRAMGFKDFKFYIDPGYSGGNTDRPSLKKLIKDIESKKVDKVVVYKLDRLSRSQLDTLYLIEKVFLANNCDFISINENFDTSSPFGKAMIGMLAVFAQLEREQIKERMYMGLEGRAKSGKHTSGGNAPIGYELVDSRLVVNKFEAMQIKEIHSLYQRGYNFNQIAKELNSKGHTHKYGSWTSTRVRIVVLNPLYIGRIKFNDSSYQGMHEPIISEETYKTSIDIHEATKRTLTKRQTHSSYLGGLIYCKRCGARYTRVIVNTYEYYICHSRKKANKTMIKDPNCKNKNYRMSTLDEIVFNEIRKLALDPEQIKRSEEEDNKEAVLKSEIQKIEKQISRFTDLYGTGILSAHDLGEKISSLNENKEKLENELQDLELIDVNRCQKFISSFDDILSTGTYEEIRLVLTSLINRIEIDGENVEIHWAFA